MVYLFLLVGSPLLFVSSLITKPEDGTSASAPIFAGVVSLLNDARLNAGKSPLGFLNPMLYKAKAIDPSTFYGKTPPFLAELTHLCCRCDGWHE